MGENMHAHKVFVFIGTFCLFVSKKSLISRGVTCAMHIYDMLSSNTWTFRPLVPWHLALAWDAYEPIFHSQSWLPTVTLHASL